VPNKLYVTNVPIVVDLRVLFGGYGTVLSSRVVTFGGDGSKTAIVEMATAGEAAEAVASLDGGTQGGRVITVCPATARHQSDADHTSLFGPMNMTADKAPADPAAATVHAWFSIEAASRVGSEVYRCQGGGTVNVTRVSDHTDVVGSFRSDEKYLGEVVRREDGGCVAETSRVRGITG
jgi:hypothetical protein